MQGSGRDHTSWRVDVALLDGLSAAVVGVDDTGRVRYANAAAESLLGRPAPDLLGSELVSLFAEPEQGGITEILRHALSGSSWHGLLPVPSQGPEPHTAALTCSPVREDGRVSGALVLIELRDPAIARGSNRDLADQLTRLARVTAELMHADDVDVVTKVMIEHAAAATGATVASLSLLVDDQTLLLKGLAGGTEATASRWATYPLASNTPAAEVVRTATPLFLTCRDEIHGRYPDLERAAEGERSMVALPLRAGARALGSVTLSFPGRRRFDAAEVEFLSILADTCAMSIARLQARSDADDQTTKLKFLADASAELSSSLDYQATLTKVARLAVPDFADWCAIQLAEDGPLRTLAVAHVDPDKVALAEELNRRYPPDPDAPSGAYHVLKTGVSELVPEVTDEMLVSATQDAEHLRLARELNLRSGLSVPLKTRRKTIGVITWVAGEEGRRFGPADRVFGEDLARRCAVAIDNAQLHTEVAEAAYRLQQAVLPEDLPDLPGWEIVVDYMPAGRTEVGGDFYDVLPLGDGRIGLLVGDVMGRGVRAAAAMAQIRASVRAYFSVDSDPDVLLPKLDGMFAKFDLTQLVTMVYAIVDPARGTMQLVNAGHPPPVVLRADGTAEQVPDSAGTPLGVRAGKRETVTVPLATGDTLLMFTDGLIERRTEDIDEGQRRLLEALPNLAKGDLGASVRQLIDQVRDHTREDDIAVLAARRV